MEHLRINLDGKLVLSNLIQTQTTHLDKTVLSRTLNGPLAVPIGEPYEEHFLVAGRRTLLVLGRTLFWFNVEICLHRVLHGTQKGSLMGTAEEPFWNPFF